MFTVPGGQIGRYRNVLVGAPQFSPGEEAVVFLTVRGATLPSVFGLNQGVFRVRVDDRTKKRMVTPPLLAGSHSPETVVRGATTRQMVQLETFGGQVQSVLAETAARGAR